MNLYQIQNQYRQLVQQLEDTGGELSEELDEALEINQADWIEKANAYSAIIREIELDAAKIREEEMRLAGLRHDRLALADRLRTKLLKALKERGGRAKLPLFTLATAHSVSVEIDVEAEQLPADCQAVEIVVRPSKLIIRGKLDRGEAVPGCRLVTHEHLRIK